MNKQPHKLTLLIALTMASAMAFANPEGAQVVQGNASFTRPDANTLNITNSRNAIINWQQFNIDRGQTTRFIQPDRNSAVLNRVLSNNPSKIHGKLRSNGQVFLINQHGLMVGAGASIDTAGFYGSTLNLTDANFLSGKLNFSGGGLGGIDNQGYIHAGPDGNVVLIAPDITNGGVIEVDGGNVILAAGESIRISSLNDGLIEFDVQAPDNTILNLGTIIAKQGAARLFAGNLQHSGAINATGLVRNADGTISLVAGGKVEVSGSVIAAGGKIEVLGDEVEVKSGAVVDASSAGGGGEILLGGDRQGLNPAIRNAISTTVEAGAEVRADATEAGDGGKVIVFAERDVHVHGAISARGGSQGGDGGFIETSGLRVLDITSVPDASAAAGKGGEWLIDPNDISIVAGAGNTNINGADPFLSTNDSALLGVDLITTALSSGQNVTITTGSAGTNAQTGTISLDTALEIDITTGTNTLRLDAQGDILINQPIQETVAGGGQTLHLEFIADRDIVIDNTITADSGAGAGGDITMQAGRSILVNADVTSDGGNIDLIANDFTAVDANRGAGDALLTIAPGITLNAGGGNIEMSIEFGTVSATAGDMTLGNLVADHLLLRIQPSETGIDILQNPGDTITALSVFINHDFADDGTVGTLANPLSMVVDNLGAHIHGSTTAPNGIFIDAQPNPGTPVVTIGVTCYGDAALGCDSYGNHLIKGLETLAGGDLVLNIADGGSGGGLNIVEPIDISDSLTIVAADDITLDTETLAASLVIRGDPVDLTSTTGSILINGGSAPGVTASIESTGGDITVNAVNLTLTEGGTDSDVVILADNGAGALLLGGTTCVSCSALFFDPRGDGATDTGVIAANFPVAIAWDGGAGTTEWTDLLNWDTDNLPLGNANVTINTVPTDTITILSGAHDVLSLSMPGDDSLELTNATLYVGADSNLASDLTLQGSSQFISVGNNTYGGNINLNGASSVLQLADPVITGPTILGINAGVFEIFGNFTATAGASVNLDGGTINLNTGGAINENQLTLDAAALNWSAGTISATGVTGTGLTPRGQIVIENTGSSTMTVDGVGPQLLDDVDVINIDFLDFINGAVLDVATQVNIVNAPDTGLITFNGTSGISVLGGGGPFTIINNGDLVKTTSSTLATIEMTLINNLDSVVAIEDGTLSLAGAPLLLLPGAGLEAAFATFDGDVISQGGIIEMFSPTSANGPLSITGDLTLDAASTVVFDIAGTTEPTDFDYINLTGASGNIILGGTAVILWDRPTPFPIATDTFDLIRTTNGTISGSFATFYAPNGVGGATFTNSPDPQRMQLAWSSVSPILFWDTNASGFWDVPGNWSLGAVPLPGEYVDINQLDESIVITIRTPVSVEGLHSQNNIDIASGGSLTITGTGQSIVGGNLTTLNGGDLSVTGDTLVASQLDWSSGNLLDGGTGQVTLHQMSALNILAGAGNLDIPVINNSLFGSSWGGGALAGAGSITNGGLLEITGAFTSSIPIVNNVLATITKSDAGLTTFTGAVTNNGAVSVDNGTLAFTQGNTWVGSFNIAAGATLQFNGVNTSLGAISGNGTLDVSAATYTNLGSIMPGGAGAIGTLSITGNMVHQGSIQIEIASTGVAGTNYDLLAISGQADLQNNLTLLAISGYTVSNGDSFTPLTFGSSITNTLTFTQIGAEIISETYNALNLSLLLNTAQTTTWIGAGGDDFWNTAGNWDLGVPGAFDDAVIPAGVFSVDIAAAADADTLSLGAGSAITQSAGIFTLGSNATLSGDYDLNGGTLAIGGTLTLDNSTLTIAGGTLSGGTLTSIGTGSVAFGGGLNTFSGVVVDTGITILNGQLMRVTGGLTINAGSTITLASTGSATTLLFVNSQSISGAGSIVMGGSSNLNFIDGGGGTAGTLTIGAGIDISGSGTIGTNSAGYFTLNLGTITAGPGDAIQNDLMTNGAGGQLVVDGGSMTMAFDWDNQGSMTVDNAGAFNLGGPFPASALAGGAYVNLDGASTTTITGTMDLGGSSFAITNAGAGTGDLRMILGGEILNGTLQRAGAATLFMGPGSTFAQLNAVTLDMDLTIGDGGVLRVVNGLTIAAGRTLFMTNTGGSTTLQANNPQSILGDGAIVMGGVSANNFIDSIGAAGTLTIGPNINISGSGLIGTNSAGYLTLNNGTITANPGDVINTDLLSNGATGSLLADGGDITVNFDWDNLGTMDVNSGGSFTLGATGGSFPSSAIAAGRYLNSDGTGTTTLAGTMDVQGGSFALTDAVTGVGDILIQGGTIANGTLTRPGTTAAYVFGTGFNTFDAVVLDMDISINDGRTMRVTNGLTINGGRILTVANTGTNTFLQHVGSMTISGAGDIVLDNGVSNLNFITGSSAGTLTIDAGINISGVGTVGTNSASIFVVNNGTITASGADTIDLRNLTNNGNLVASGGGVLTYGVLTDSNDGIIDIGAGSTLSTGNGDLNNLPGATIRGTGSIVVGTGTLTNDGTIQPGGAGVAGTLTVTGNLDNSTGTIEIEIQATGIAGTNYDLLAISGQANLQGNVALLAISGYTVAQDDAFTPLTYGSHITDALTFVPITGSVIPNYAPLTQLDIALSLGTAISWDDGGATGDWFDPLNWSGDAVPGAVDDVTIGGVDLTINITAAADAGTLNLASGYLLDINAGSLSIASNAQIDGDMAVTNSTLTVGGTLDTIGLVTLLDATVTAGAWDQQGMLHFAEIGGITLDDNDSFVNGAGFVNNGLIEIDYGNGNTLGHTNATFANGFTNNGTISFIGDVGVDRGTLIVSTGTLVNNGTIASPVGGAGIREIDGAVTNLNLIDIDGDFDIVNNAGRVFDNTAGTLDVAAGFTLGVVDGTTSIGSGTTLAGSGTLQLNGSHTLLLDSDFTAVAGVDIDPAGVVSFDAVSPFTYTNQSTLNLNDDSFASNFNFDNQGTLHFLEVGGIAITDNDSFINSASFANSGLIEIDYGNGNTLGHTNATFANGFTNNGTISFIGDVGVDRGTLIVSTGTLVNNGTIASPVGGAGIREIDGAVTNLNLIDIDGDFDIVNNAGRVFDNTAGTLDVAAGFTLGVVDGTTSIGSGTTLAGSGTLQLNGSHTLLLDSDFTAVAGVDIDPAGVVSFDAVSPFTYTNQSTLNLNDDSFASNFNFDNQGTLHFLEVGGIAITDNDSFINSASFANSGLIEIDYGNGNTLGHTNATFANGFTNNGTISFIGTVGTDRGTLIVSTGTLVNNGTIASPVGGAGIREIDGAVTNLNLIDIDGDFDIVNNAGRVFDNTAGTLDVAAGFTLGVVDGTTSIGSGTTLAGSGTLQLNGSHTLLLDSDFTAVAGVDIDPAGVVSFDAVSPFTYTNQSTLNLNDDSFASNFNFDNQGTLHFLEVGGIAITDNDSFINSASFANSGLIEIDYGNGNTLGHTNATFANGFTNNGTISFIGTVGTDRGTLIVSTGTLVNNGTIASPVGGAGIREIDGAVTNLNLIDIDGDFDIVNNAGRVFDNTAGTLDVAAGFTLGVVDGTTSIGSGTTLAGSGTLQLNGSHTLLLDSDFTSAAASVVIDPAGVVVFDAVSPVIYTNQGALTLLDDTINANVNFDNQGILQFGRIGGITIDDNDSFVNSASFGNSGLIEVDFGNGNTLGHTTATFANAFTNDGIIRFIGDTDNGTLVVPTLVNGAGGSIEAPAATGSRSLNTSLDNQGLIAGSLTIVGDVANNGGVIHPGGIGAVGLLTINGDYTQDAAGSLLIEVDDTGSVAGVDYDQLVVNTAGSATLAGTLDVFLLNLAPPGAITVVNVTSGGSIVGTFDTETIDPAFNAPVYGATTVDLSLAGGQAISWAGGPTGIWNLNTNWSSNTIPTGADTVSISGATVTIAAAASADSLSLAAGATIDHSGSTLTLVSASTVDGTYILSNGILSVATTLDIGGNFIWNGGTLTGAGATTVLGTATASLTGTTSNMDLDGHALVLQSGSTTTYSSTFLPLRLGNNATLTNAATSTFNMTGTVGVNALAGSGTVANAGSFTYNNPGGTPVVNVPFDNSGTLDVQAGSLSLNGGGTSGGVFTIAGTLSLGGTHVITDADINGAGTLISTGAVTVDQVGTASYTVTATQVNTGTLTLNHAATVPNVTLNNGTLIVGSTLDLSGNLTWNGGTLTGAGATTVLGTATASLTGTTSNMDLDGHALVLQSGSTTTYNSTFLPLRLGNNATLTNAATSTFNMTGTVGVNALAGSGTVANAGSFTYNNPGGTPVVNVPFDNSGTLDVQAGSLSLNGGGTSGGVFTIAGTLSLGGTHVITDADINGAGTLISTGAVTVDQVGTASYTVTATQVNTGTLTLNHAATVPNVTLNNGTLIVGSTLDLSGNLTWNGGTLTGAGATTVLGTATASLTGTTSNMDLDGHALVLQSGSTTTYNSTFLPLRLGNNATLTNAATSTFNMTGTVGVNALAGSGTVANAGSFTYNNPGGTPVVNVPFDNSGTLDVQAGSLSLNGGGTSGGVFTIAGTLSLGGTHVITDADINGAGTLISTGAVTVDQVGTASYTVTATQVNTGTLTLNHAATVPNVTLNNGTLIVGSTLDLSGNLTWNGGTLTGAGATTVLGTATASLTGTTSNMDLDGHALVLQSGSTTTYNSTFLPLRLGNNATLTNAATSTFNMTGTVGVNALAGSGTVANAGSFTYNNPGGTPVVNVPFDNSGTLDVQAGSLSLNGGGTSGGVFTIAGTLSLGGTHVITDADINGAGTLISTGAVTVDQVGTASYTVTATQVNTGTLTLNHAATVSNLTLSNGILEVASTLDVSGSFTWSGGILRGAGTTQLLGTASASLTGTTSNMDLDGHALVLQSGSTTTYSSTFLPLRFSNGAMLSNAGTLNLTGTVNISQLVGGIGTIDNSGTVNADSSLSIGVDFNNDGDVFVDSAVGGSVSLTLTAAVTGTGNWDLGDGDDLLNASLTLNGGALTGAGSVFGNVVSNGGTVAPGGAGAIGLISINGDFSQDSTASLLIEVDDTGPVAGVDYDQLVVNTGGSVIVDGTLDVSLLGGAPLGNIRVLDIAGGAVRAGTFISEIIDPAFNLPVYNTFSVDLALVGVITWDGPTTGGFWNTAVNWSGDIVPLSGDDVAIGSGISLTVAATADANTLSLAAGSTITVTNGALTINNPTTLVGNLAIDGATASVVLPTGDLDIGGTLTLGGGALDVAGDITVTGLTAWNGPGTGASFALPNGGNFNADGGFDIGPATNGDTLTLAKTLLLNAPGNWGGNAYTINGGASIVNFATLTASNTGLATIIPVFDNTVGATLIKSGGGGTLSFDSGLINDGTILVQADTVATPVGFVNDGTIDVSGFASIFDAAAGFSNGAGGLITGDGTLVAPADGTGLLNQGTIEPGDVNTIGQLNLTGDFTNAAGGNLVLDLQAPLPDPNQDRLQILGQAFLGGTLTLNAVGGYTVVDGHQFNPVSYFGGAVGTFASIVPIASETVTPAYNPSPLLLTLNLGAPTFIFSNSTGNWNTATNWSSNLVPGIGDNVDLGTASVTIAAAANANTLSLAAGGRLTITGGGLTLAGNSTLDGRLILQGGTLALGGSTLTLNGRFDWSGTSTISNGTLSMPAASRFNITGGATNSLLNVIANIAAPTAYSGGNLVLSNSTFNNTGNFDLQGPRLVNGIGTAAFNSQDGGTLTKSSGGGVGGFIGTTAVTSLGNVAVQNGTLNLNGATVNLGAGDVLSSGASGTLVANVTNNGGTIRPGGAAAVGQLSIQGNYTNSSGALEVEINGPTTNDVLAVTGTTNFSAAAVTSSLNISYLSYVPAVNELHTVITCTTACSSTSSFGTLNNPIGIVHTPLYDSPAGQVRLRVDSVAFGWIGASGGAWGNGANWSLGVAPDATIDVVLPALNVSINGVATANSLIVDTGGLLTINGGGNLSLASTLRVRSGATLNNSGTLAVTGLTTVNGSYTQNTGANTTLAGLTVGGAFGHNGGAATVAGAALFTGSLGVSGGTLTMSGASAAINGPFDMTAGTVRFGTGANSIGGTNNLWQGGTLRSTTGQQTLALQAGATLQLQGAATKTLRDIRLDMSQGDVNLFGSGNLVLTNAVIDNTNGTSFHSYGNGSLTGDASSQFINNGGLFENVSGVSQIAVDFINDNASQVRVLSGSLTLLDTDLADQAAYSTNLPGTLGFAAPRTLTGSLVNAGTLAAIGPTTTLTLPTGFTNTGNVALDQATLNLNGQTLTLPAGKLLSGRGTIQNGQVVNNGGVVLVGGPGQLGNLTLDGDYTHNPGSAMVVEVFNNGNTNQTASDTFTVTSAGNTTLNGGALVIGFASNSAGLVLADVSPLQLANAPTGQFGQVIDAGGNILGFKFSGGVLTILGVTPKTPDALIDDLVGFIQNKEEIREIIESNESLAQIIGDEIARRREQEEEEDSSLICTPGA